MGSINFALADALSEIDIVGPDVDISSYSLEIVASRRAATLLSYVVHKFLTYFFTGKSIKFGNFTCLPKSVVKNFIIEKS